MKNPSDMTGLTRLAWCVVAALLVLPASCWDANAGIVPPLAASSRTVSVSTNEAAKQGIIDGNDQVQRVNSTQPFVTHPLRFKATGANVQYGHVHFH
jgi:hypothetical protein